MAGKRSCKCESHDGTERWHGTPNGYSYHWCRCDLCVEGNRLYCREWAAANPAVHSRRVQDWRERNRDRFLQKSAEYRANNTAARRARKEYDRDRYRRLAPNLRPGAPYTPEDDRVVLDLSMTELQRAVLLGRSADSVRGRLYYLRGRRR